ncbi:MAG: SMC-Scp complex subunit ScpB [Firmicutes bacterium]|nr:SMC-Scp complex subunit ScpB [Bacillota bacterium]
MDRDNKTLSTEALLEAALFLSHEPLSIEQLCLVCQVSAAEVKNGLGRLKHALEQEDRGLLLLERHEGYQLGTKPEAAAYLEKLFSEEYSEAPLSQAALETLSIIAFKQPITKIEIETIRGVKVDGVIENLLKRRLIKVAGRKEGIGRPLLYATTPEFLRYFGLKDLSDLKSNDEESVIGFSGNGETK